MELVVRTGSLEEVSNLDVQIPEFGGRNSKDRIRDRLRERDHLILIACLDDLPVAFKVGYGISKGEFYSWIGAVLPAYRGREIAQKLLEEQERLVFEKGYWRISVKSMNRYRYMLMLLIKNDYQICGFDAVSEKIRFEKEL